MKRWKTTHEVVRIGTMPRSCVWVRRKEPLKVGALVEFGEFPRRGKWQRASVWQMGPPPENMLYLALE